MKMNSNIYAAMSAPLISIATDVVCIYFSFRIGKEEDHPINLLIVLLAIALGMLCGIMVTPISKEEGQIFETYTKYIFTFISGYLFSKIDPIITASLNPEIALEVGNMFRILSFLCCFILAVTAVYIVRAYVYLSTPDKPEKANPD